MAENPITDNKMSIGLYSVKMNWLAKELGDIFKENYFEIELRMAWQSIIIWFTPCNFYRVYNFPFNESPLLVDGNEDFLISFIVNSFMDELKFQLLNKPINDGSNFYSTRWSIMSKNMGSNNGGESNA